METALKLAPLVVTGITAVSNQVDDSYGSDIYTRAMRKHDVLKISMYALGLVGCMQLARGEYTDLVNITVMSVIMQFMHGFENTGTTRWAAMLGVGLATWNSYNK